jgi:subtilisin family serine protease
MLQWVARPATLAVLLLTAVFAGCLANSDDPDIGPTPPDAVDEFRPRVVVAIIDTGIQPYHMEFRQLVEDPTAHPSTYIPGYPAETDALEITLDGEDLEASRDADADLWGGAKRDTMYWIPGTKIVGIIGMDGDLPGGGHGTMTASRATGNTISIPGEEVLLVVVNPQLQLFAESPGRAVRWAADQPWIDIQSNSWGTPFMCVGPLTDSATKWMEAFKYARDKQVVLAATHNGHANFGLLGYPSQCQDTAGPAGVIAVGGTDNGGLIRWANWFPQIAADACANPAVKEDTLDEIENTGGGTSSATPFSAGAAAKILLEARRTLRDPTTGMKEGGVLATAHEGAALPATGPLADGVFTVDELQALLFKTAISPPQGAESDGDACGSRVEIPPGATGESLYPFIGYGEVNAHSVAHALAVLMGEAELPARPNEDTLYAQDQDARRALWG